MTFQLSKSAQREIREAVKNVVSFSRFVLGVHLRPYQQEAALAIQESVFLRDGESFVVIFSRQSGKDEMLACLSLFFLFRFYEWGADMVVAQPTFKPQTINAMERLRKRGLYFGRRLTRTAGYIMRMGQARIAYFSAEPTANQVGATAERLLWMNEAQDIDSGVYDKRFAPMAASGNATRVFSGTSWTSSTLLARELRAARVKEKADGKKRVFIVDADEVGRSNPHYRRSVQSEIVRLGRQNPLVRTQYFCEEIDAQVGMFNAARLALMQGDQPEQAEPTAGHVYAFLLDVGGQDEALLNLDGMGNPGRDYTRLSIVDVDLSTLSTLQAPTYRIVKRLGWQGVSHLQLFGQLSALVDVWRPQHIVMDATGVGEGLWAMMHKAHPTRVIPVKFSQQVKSEIGWGYIAAIETGRVRDCCPTDEVRIQYQHCQSEVLPGPGKTMRWGVKDGTRGPDGLLVHDDIPVADSLVSILDKLQWISQSPTVIVRLPDPLRGMESNF